MGRRERAGDQVPEWGLSALEPPHGRLRRNGRILGRAVEFTPDFVGAAVLRAVWGAVKFVFFVVFEGW